MADISITAASVLASTSASTNEGFAGATITAGQSLYLDTVTNTLKLADADGTSPINTIAGIALNGASSGQPVKYAIKDASFTLGATLLAGDVVYLSDTPGGLTSTIAELEAGDKVIVVGVMTTTTLMNLSPVAGGAIAA
jgi:hypothetical protein